MTTATHLSRAVEYRADLDGLRAIAVLPVMLFHAGVPAFSGGFVGVDVFFVISGYLITGIVAREVRHGSFSLADFYLRRARRILPALFVVLATVLAVGTVLLLPGELRDLGKAAAATALFGANVHLWRTASYFGRASELDPLRMAWSLGVEEQFYVVWPLVVVLAVRSRWARILLLPGLGAASLVFSQWAVAHDRAGAFYLLPSRGWELMLGAALMLGPRPTGARGPGLIADGASVVGLALIVGSVVRYGAATAFPGVTAVLPCAGAAALIWAGPGALVNRLVLQRRPLVFVGLLSYSLYLWHWPILSFTRVQRLGRLSPAAATCGLVLAGLLSYLTWRRVERVFRQAPPGRPRGRILLSYGALSLAFAGVSGLVAARPLAAERLEAVMAQVEEARAVDPDASACAEQASAEHLPLPRCVAATQGGGGTIALWGDSHAMVLARSLRTWAAEHGRGFVQLTASSCPPLPAAEVVQAGAPVTGCSGFNARALDALLRDGQIDTVVLAGRWALYTENTTFGAEFGPPFHLVADGETRLERTTSRRVFAAALEGVVSTLRRAGKTVVLVGQAPETPVSVPDCVIRVSSPLAGPERCAALPSQVAERLHFSDEVIGTLARSDPGVRMIRPAERLCGRSACAYALGGKLLYRDSNHLSAAGAALVARDYDRAFRAATARR